jgi:magnesium transporter
LSAAEADEKFHFEDITKHTQRVLDRILSLVDDYQGSDWIAHGILDSIVDAFFPMIRFVDNEVEDIDHLTIDPYIEPTTTSTIPSPQSSETSIGSGVAIEMSEKISLDSTGQKIWREPTPPIQPSHLQRLRQHLNSIKPYNVPRFFIYIKLFWTPLSNGNNARPHTDRPHAFGRYEMIKRITDTRKLVTGLSRLLHGKHNVVGRMRKRARLLDFEGVEAYIGDLEGKSRGPDSL